MTNKLAENIRKMRKQHAMTQEQLAEVLGVTTGAVHKWEAKLSQPEINLIMEMADFFNTSVDILLGYEMKDNSLSKTVERLKQYRIERDGSGISEAEKALKRYPNIFDIVFNSAYLYMVFGIQQKNKSYLHRALELFENSVLLVAQNTEPKISESSIYGLIAQVLLELGDTQEGIDILIKHNADGIYDDIIGFNLATDKTKTEEALSFLSDAILGHVAGVIRTVIGYINVFFYRKDYDSLAAITKWGVDMLEGLRCKDEIIYFDRIQGIFLACQAEAYLAKGEENNALEALLRAKKLADRFDANPNYDLDALRFVEFNKAKGAYDDVGDTAISGIENALNSFMDDKMTQMWEKLKNE